MNFDQDSAPVDTPDVFDDSLIETDVEFVAEADQPFGSVAHRRWALMSVVVLGGAAAVIIMKLLVGPPAAAIASSVADQSMDGFILAEAQTHRADLVDNASFVHLLDSDIDQWQVDFHDLQGNPFSGFGTDRTMSGNSGFAASTADAASRSLQRRLNAMSVSMVIRGTVTVALVDGVRMSVGKSVRTQDGLDATLIAVRDHTLDIELREPSTQAVLRGAVRIVPLENER